MKQLMEHVVQYERDIIHQVEITQEQLVVIIQIQRVEIIPIQVIETEQIVVLLIIQLSVD